jgi:hypothetical protein
MGTPNTIPVLILPIPSGFFGIWVPLGMDIVIFVQEGVLFRNLCVLSEQIVNILTEIQENRTSR